MLRLAMSLALALALAPAAWPPAARAAEQGDADSRYQLQLLQQEIMQLRGQLEELSYRLQRMQASQDERYMELDRRLQQLMQAGAGPAPAGAAGPPPADTPALPDLAAPLEGPLDEQTLYDAALQLIRARQYDPAIVRLEELIEKFPEGDLTANAYYWLGEVHAAKPAPDYEKARQALVQVITYYPEHRKTADAGFKLGKVYYQMGDCARATNILQQVMTQFADETVARLAEEYLNTLECGS